MIDLQLQAMHAVLGVLRGKNLTAALARAELKLAQPALRAAVQDVAYGTLRHLGLLRAALTALANKPIPDEDLQALILVALYQLQFTDAAPYAVVDDAVEACTQLRKTSAKGLVNALLRNFQRRRAAILSEAQSSEAGRWSHPQWWIDELKRAYPNAFEKVLEVGNTHPPMTLRINRRRTSMSDYAAQLAAAGLDGEVLSDVAFLLRAPVSVERLPGFEQGLVSVQDRSAQRGAKLLDLQPHMRVLDACAAPGGKSAHILETADVLLTALDRDEQRLVRVRQTLQRLGLDAAQIRCADAAADGWWDGTPFDRILLDAPCTASGIVRRHPDAKWLRRPEDIASLAAQQRVLLANLWQMLARGGKLLYATCSVFPAENHLQVSTFLEAHPDSEQLPLSGTAEGSQIDSIRGQILPDARHDGFFYALLQKT